MMNAAGEVRPIVEREYVREEQKARYSKKDRRRQLPSRDRADCKSKAERWHSFENENIRPAYGAEQARQLRMR